MIYTLTNKLRNSKPKVRECIRRYIEEEDNISKKIKKIKKIKEIKEIKKIKKIKNKRKTAKSEKSGKSAVLPKSLMSFF